MVYAVVNRSTKLLFLKIPKSINSPIDPPAPKLVTALNASLDSPVLLSMDWAKKVLPA